MSRLGYGAVLVLLILSSAETYRIQDSISERHAAIYQRYLVQDAALRTLRRDVFLAANHVRDFFLSAKPDRGAQLESEIRKVERDCQAALDRLAFTATPAGNEDRIRKDLAEFWAMIEPVARTVAQVANGDEYEFVQREIVPRRTQLYTELLEMTEAEQVVLQEAETDFTLSRRSALRRLLETLGLCVALGVLVSWFSLRHADRLEAETARQYAEVTLAKRQLEQLSARLVDTEEEGRRRLSRELHDEIGQTLTALRIEISQALKQAERPQARESLMRARALTERSVETVRNICLLLRPALLDELGLVPAVQWQLQEFSRRSGIACEFTESGGDRHLSDAVKICVYRIVQESLNNCVKHAGATRIQVTIRAEADMLTAEVADDGCGFTWNAQGMPGGGLGLLGMRERAVMVGGRLTIESSPGHGTRVIARIPVSEAPAAQSEPALDGVKS